MIASDAQRNAQTDAQREWFQQLLKQSRAQLDNDGKQNWLEQARTQAAIQVDELPLPHRAQEAWRYTSLKGLYEQQFHTAASVTAPVLQQLDARWQVPGLDAYRLVLVNGHYSPLLSNLDGLVSGVRIESLKTVLSSDPKILARWFGQVADHRQDLFTALNTALINDGVFIHVGNGVELERPIELLYLTVAEDQMGLLMQPRNLIVLEAGARVTLVERFVGEHESPYFHNGLSEISVGEEATLEHYRLQDEGRKAYHLSNLYLSQQKGSDYRGCTLAFGGIWSRTQYSVALGHEDAACSVNGLFMAGDRQLVDLHLDVNHAVPGCSSRENIRGILYGTGRAVVDGHIRVERNAQQTDAHFYNDNLLLSRESEVDTKPQLEIYADDVKCAHGATVGSLDPQQLFYLRSRGLGLEAAKSMLCMGFANELLETIPLLPLREHAAARLQQVLAGALSGGGV